MLSLGLAGLDFKTGAHEGPGHDHWGGAPPATLPPMGLLVPLWALMGLGGGIPLSIGIPHIYICTWPWVHLKGIPDPGPGVGVYMWAAYFYRAPLDAIVDTLIF